MFSFLWVGLQIEELLKLTTRHDLRNHLRTCPRGMSQTYGLLLSRIYEQHKSRANLATRVLTWLSFSVRPLTLAELQEALSISIEGNDPSAWTFDDATWAVKEVCLGLVNVDLDQRAVYLSHQSVPEYLMDVRHDFFPTGLQDVARTCISLLNDPDVQAALCEDPATLTAQVKRRPFLRYAAENWGHHLRDASDLGLSYQVRELLRDARLLDGMVQFMGLADCEADSASEMTQRTSRLFTLRPSSTWSPQCKIS